MSSKHDAIVAARNYRRKPASQKQRRPLHAMASVDPPRTRCGKRLPSGFSWWSLGVVKRSSVTCLACRAAMKKKASHP